MRPRIPVPGILGGDLSPLEFQEGIGRLSQPDRGQFWQCLLILGFDTVNDEGVGAANLIQLASLIDRAFPGSVGGRLNSQISAISKSLTPEVGINQGGDSVDHKQGSIPSIESQAATQSHQGVAGVQSKPEAVVEDAEKVTSSEGKQVMEEGANESDAVPSPSQVPDSGSDKAGSPFAALLIG